MKKWNVYFNGNGWIIDRYDHMIQIASSEAEAREMVRHLKRIEKIS
jgi:hypothetical protein